MTRGDKLSKSLSPPVKWVLCILGVVLSSGKLQFFRCRIFVSSCLTMCNIKSVVFILVIYWAPTGCYCPRHFTFIISLTLHNIPLRLILSCPFKGEETGSKRLTCAWPQSWLWAPGCPTLEGMISSPIPHSSILPFLFSQPLRNRNHIHYV